MAKRQTRKSVSLNGKLYRRAKQYADERGTPLTQITERALKAVLDGTLQLDMPPPIEPPPCAYETVKARRADPVVRLVVPPLPSPRQYPGATCAACTAWIPTSTKAPLYAPWGRNDAMVRVCAGCYSDNTDADAVSSSTRGFRSIDRLLHDWCFTALRAACKFDWFDPGTLAAALDIPGADVNPQRRNSFDNVLVKLTRRGHFERTGRRMAFRYRITDAGRREIERQLEGAAA